MSGSGGGQRGGGRRGGLTTSPIIKTRAPVFRRCPESEVEETTNDPPKMGGEKLVQTRWPWRGGGGIWGDFGGGKTGGRWKELVRVRPRL